MDLGEFLLPGIELRPRGLIIAPGLLAILAEPTASIAVCPGCKSSSGRIHGRYLRTVADLPCQGRRVILRLHVRRFRCDNAACPRRTFTEPLQSVAPYAQATTRLAATHRAIGFALGGEAGARLSSLLGTPASPDTLLRRVRQAAIIEAPSPRVLGVDDFAFRKGQTYGTILVDLERRRVIDLLPDREAATVAAWLGGHPGVEIISRDRASAYSQAAREATPHAMQVADRWHLLSNMRDVLERVLHQRSAAIRELVKEPSQGSPAGPGPGETQPASIGPPVVALADGHLARKARFDEVKRLHGEGHSLRSIAASMRLHHRTVERYVRSDSCPDWCPGRRRSSGLDRFADFIGRRVREGCRNSRQILRELQGMGYRGGKTALRVYVRRVEAESGAPRPEIPPALAPRIEVPSARRLAISVVRRPDGRSAEDRLWLETLAKDVGEIGEAIELAGKVRRVDPRPPARRADGLADPRRGLVGGRPAVLRAELTPGRGGGPGRDDGGMEQRAGRGPGEPIEHRRNRILRLSQPLARRLHCRSCRGRRTSGWPSGSANACRPNRESPHAPIPHPPAPPRPLTTPIRVRPDQLWAKLPESNRHQLLRRLGEIVARRLRLDPPPGASHE